MVVLTLEHGHLPIRECCRAFSELLGVLFLALLAHRQRKKKRKRKKSALKSFLMHPGWLAGLQL